MNVSEYAFLLVFGSLFGLFSKYSLYLIFNIFFIHFVYYSRLHRIRKVGAVVRAFASHQYVSGSIPGHGVICGLSSLLVLFSAPFIFTPGTPIFPSSQKPTFPNFNSILEYIYIYREWQVSTSGKGRVTTISKKTRKTSIKVTVLIGLLLKSGFSGGQSRDN